jgi:putative Ca2+/H+ antiporter (TMEM165/GDT1 family)
MTSCLKLKIDLFLDFHRENFVTKNNKQFRFCFFKVNKESTKVTQDAEAGGTKKLKASPFAVLFRIFVQAFTMTFVAEWGDRSQITTIILSARENLWGVITGGVIGHAICTGIGVLGGRMIAQKISVRTGK